MAKTYIWAHDAGHEWLAVKIDQLIELGIAHKISQYSYMKNGTAYLEGDCDAALFIDAYTAKNGTAPKTKQGKYWDTQPLRRFARYTAPNSTATATPLSTELNEYVERLNKWSSLFGGKPEVTLPLTQEGVDRIIARLNGDLSPENLHCDGEITAAEAGRKYRFYKSVADALADYAWRNKLNMGEVYEL
jgi:hypothetical protein